MKFKQFCYIFLLLIFTKAEARYSDTLKQKTYLNAIVKKDYLIPSILLTASLISFTDNGLLDNSEFKQIRTDWIPNFHSHLDDYLQFAPIAIVFGSDFFGAKAKNSLWDQSFILLKAEIFIGLLVLPLKYLTNVKRPDESNSYSFPSGHTAEAFMAATFLHKEFGEQSILYSIAGYTIATTVGLFRIANNKHWASDVLAGAGFGILATNLAYKIGRLKSTQHLSHQLSFVPVYSNNNFNFIVHFTF